MLSFFYYSTSYSITLYPLSRELYPPLMIILLSPQQKRPVPPQTSHARMGSASPRSGAVTENRSAPTVLMRLMQSAVRNGTDEPTNTTRHIDKTVLQDLTE